eukprot:TRINITY_DN11950_c0_g1_i2.p1 TRINITY_DN11950_c0_g1~~TRINITY_DN11950_c0_g1_i2.p1  ORF type:complete len:457 (+),score=62.31 TRINITY_DN11950_c0_g1_i2:130-1500(+)
MEENCTINSDDDEEIVFAGINSFLNSSVSPENSNDGYTNSSQGIDPSSMESTNQASYPSLQKWIDYLVASRHNPKQIAALHSSRNVEDKRKLSELVAFLNEANVLPLLRACGFNAYNNELEGIFIQKAGIDFSDDGFDMDSFPFDDKGGPQRENFEKYSYVHKYWDGKSDKSQKMRKFYTEDALQRPIGLAIFVVFRKAETPSGNSQKGPRNKKRRVDGTPKSFQESNNAPTTHAQFQSMNLHNHNSNATQYNNNINESAYADVSMNDPSFTDLIQPTNVPLNDITQSQFYAQYSNNTNVMNVGPENTNLTTPMPVGDYVTDPQQVEDNFDYNNSSSIDHVSEQLNLLSLKVTAIDTRVKNLEFSAINHVQTKTRSLDAKERQICKAILQVLRENNNRYPKSSKFLTKVRALVGALGSAVINKLLYTVLETLGIIQLQDNEWVLIDEVKARQFEEQ